MKHKGQMKKVNKIILSMLFILFFAIPVITNQSTVNAASAKLNKKTLTLSVGTSFNLKVKNTSETVKWSSNDKTVAKVSSKGKVTAISAGEVTIYANVGSQKLNCKLTVVSEISTGDFYYFTQKVDEEGYVIDTGYEFADLFNSDVSIDSGFGYVITEDVGTDVYYSRMPESKTYNGIISVYGYEKLKNINSMDPYIEWAKEFDCSPTYYVEFTPKSTRINTNFDLLAKAALRFYFNSDNKLVGSSCGYDLDTAKWITISE